MLLHRLGLAIKAQLWHVLALALLPFMMAVEPTFGATRQAAPPPLASASQIRAAETTPLKGHDPYPSDEFLNYMNEPFKPFRISGNIYYVGTHHIGVYLITTADGHILLDGGFPQSAPQIIRNIRTLGFNVTDIKYLINSHGHVDHAGGLASLQRASHARFVANAGDRSELEQGADKLWFGYPPIKVDQLIAHGETLTLGDVTLTAHLTYGHTLGCTSWTMGLTGEDGKPHRAVFVCANGVMPNEPLTGDRVPIAREGLARLEQIEADIFLGSHGIFFDLSRKRLFQLSKHAQNPFIDPAGFRAFKESVRIKTEAALESFTAAQQ